MNERISIADKKPEAKSQNLVPQIRRKAETDQSMDSPVDRVLFLQRTIGNQAVGRLIKSGALQAKLRIGQPGDVYEQEADRVAEQVMRMPDVSSSKNTKIQRKCPKCQKGLAGLQDKDKKLQRKEVYSQTPEVTPQTEANINALKGGGQPLPESTRSFYEPRFGHDLSKVRIHSDENAAEAARTVNARAFTAGRDVVFGKGEYTPQNGEGQRLLAHELVHVVQQSGGQLDNLQRKPETEKGGKKKEKTKAKKNPCDRDIWFEGTCQFLVDHSKFICCDPDKGLTSIKKRTDIEGKECPSDKWTPIFSCDNNCKKALEKGCDDNDNWMAVPKGKYKCNDELTICYNGNQAKGYVRDNSVVDKYEVSPGIKNNLGVTEKQGFKGAVYRPGAKQEIIDKNPCCKR